jgi:hypothetical protein
MVFFNSPYRETPKSVLKIKIKIKSRLVGGWVWDLANVRGVRRFVFGGPSVANLSAGAGNAGFGSLFFCRFLL